MKLKEEITSFVDNEVKDIELRIQLTQLIQTNNDIKIEYLIQKEMKTLLQKRFSFCCTPQCVCEKILNKIYSEFNSNISNRPV